MLFDPISILDVTLKNRVVVAPMHQYSAEKGFATDWHLMNAGRYAAGGAGLVIMESTKVERRGCGTVGDLGIWDDAHIPGLRRCTDFIRLHNSVPGLQLGHSGRKARRFRPWEGGAPLTVETDLFAAGLDSMGIMQLMISIEERFGVRVPESAVTRDNFSTASSLAAMVRRCAEPA